MIVIRELLDKPLTYWWNHISSEMWVGQFRSDGRKEVTYRLSFTLLPQKVIDRIPELLKIQKVNNSDVYTLSFYAEKSADEWGILNTGNASLVFSTVVAMAKEFIRKIDQGDFIVFSAKEKSREKLYRTMAQTISKKSDMIYRGEGKDSDHQTVFILEKK